MRIFLSGAIVAFRAVFIPQICKKASPDWWTGPVGFEMGITALCQGGFILLYLPVVPAMMPLVQMLPDTMP